MAKVTLEKPQLRFMSLVKIIFGLLVIAGSVFGGLIISVFGLFIIGIPVMILGSLGAIPIFREARRHSKFWCLRCEKGIVVYKYEYTAVCPRCRAGFHIDWEA
ncbi:hypothetical protein [Brevibacillus choshinensis]|uniref:hypothetical protein n=1 Tax=Brevibacillus choshinensis TaxID=54911 RepID=UPI002E1B5671|nr:hypothetical protein [Brevibacillus choshinensis]